MLGSPPSVAGSLTPRASAGIELASGRLVRARLGKEAVTVHPDTGQSLLGVQVPYWPAILTAAERCGNATHLGYMGVDVVLDERRGPLVIEVNVRPGLEIQNVTGIGLAQQLGAVATKAPARA